MDTGTEAMLTSSDPVYSPIRTPIAAAAQTAADGTALSASQPSRSLRLAAAGAVVALGLLTASAAAAYHPHENPHPVPFAYIAQKPLAAFHQIVPGDVRRDDGATVGAGLPVGRYLLTPITAGQRIDSSQLGPQLTVDINGLLVTDIPVDESVVSRCGVPELGHQS